MSIKEYKFAINKKYKRLKENMIRNFSIINKKFIILNS